jgi:hypothetical protein
MSRALVVALLLTAALLPADAVAARADVAASACPGPVSPAPPGGTHAAALSCLDAWGLSGAALPVEMALPRGRAAVSLADLVVTAGTTLASPADDPFDDDDGHPDEVSISQLAALGIMRGASTGEVFPDRSLTRGQLAALVVRTAERLSATTITAEATPFTDLGGTALLPAIEQAYAAGLMTGTSPTTFAPAAAATQGQYATVATRILGLLVDAGTIDPPDSPTTSFALSVVPSAVQDAIGGQRILLLVTLTRDDEPDLGPVTVGVSATGAAVPEEAASLTVGGVGELTAILHGVEQTPPGSDATEVRTPLVVTGVRGDQTHRVVVPVRVLPGEDDRRATAEEHLSRWTDWLATAHPELGIDASTEWTPTAVQPHILVVSHYLFLSSEWELGLTWHIMIAPYDWSRIYLRPRGELEPTLAFELSSYGDPNGIPTRIDPPIQVDR